MGETVEIRFRPTWLYLLRSALATMASARHVRWIRRLGWAAGITGLSLAFYGRAALAGIFLTAFFVIEGALWGGSIAQAIYCVWGARDWREPQTIRFGREGFECHGSVTSSSVSWEHVTSVRARRGLLILMFRGINGLCVPLRGRIDDVDSRDLIEFVREHEGRPAVSTPAPGTAPLVAGPDDVLIEFEVTQPILEAALRDIFLKGGTALSVGTVFGVMWLLFGGLPVLNAMTEPSRATLFGAIPSLLLLALFAFLLFGTFGWQAARGLKQFPEHGRLQQILLGPGGIRAQGGLAQAELGWESVTRSVETTHFFLLFFSRAVAFYLPKAALESEAQQRVRAIVQTHSSAFRGDSGAGRQSTAAS